MGLDVVDEGVATESERAHLAGIGCRYGQGYLFARPLRGEDAERLVTSASTIKSKLRSAPGPEAGLSTGRLG